MAHVVYYVAVSIDGFIADADGGVEWLAPFEKEEEDYGYTRFLQSVSGLLMGSNTYEQIRSFGDWPYGDTPCWVFSERVLPLVHPALFLRKSGPRRVMEEVESRSLEKVWLVGGSQLAASFREEGLIDEYVLFLIPRFLGKGIPLFEAPCRGEELILTEEKSYENGVVRLRYRKAGDGKNRGDRG